MDNLKHLMLQEVKTLASFIPGVDSAAKEVALQYFIHKYQIDYSTQQELRECLSL